MKVQQPLPAERGYNAQLGDPRQQPFGNRPRPVPQLSSPSPDLQIYIDSDDDVEAIKQNIHFPSNSL
jgi:hypothetical protein